MVNTGFESYAGTRKLAWDTLGTVVETAMTAEEALRIAHLADWNVRKEAVFTGAGQLVPDSYAMVRDNPFSGEPEPFAGVVGKLFTPVQNEAHVEFLDTLTDASGAHIEAAGSLDGGRRVYVSMKMPSHLTLGGVDAMDTYITAINSHDGNSAFTVIVTPVRIECRNMVQAAIKGARAKATVRHTAGSGGAIARVRETLGLTFSYMDAFELEAQKMLETEITSQRFGQIVGQLYPVAKDQSDLVNRRAADARGAVRDLFDGSPTMTEIRGTAWAGYNAVTEYIDHFAPTRGTEESELVRARYNLTGRNDAIKSDAFRLFANV
jgi:phage/plasmid-like protein (TIGR03299 family)